MKVHPLTHSITLLISKRHFGSIYCLCFGHLRPPLLSSPLSPPLPHTIRPQMICSVPLQHSRVITVQTQCDGSEETKRGRGSSGAMRGGGRGGLEERIETNNIHADRQADRQTGSRTILGHITDKIKIIGRGRQQRCSSGLELHGHTYIHTYVLYSECLPPPRPSS